MAIISLDEYKDLVGLSSTDTRKDPQIEALLESASKAVETYTGRSFALASGTPSDREFQYDFSGILDIDDCTGVTAIESDGGVPGNVYPLNANQWTLMPQDDSEVYYYIILRGGPYLGGSPEMGFERNLDQFPETAYHEPLITVTGTWGWDEVPADVKLATALTLQEFVSGGSGSQGENLTSESIEGWSRGYGRSASVQALAIPNRARDILSAYQRIFV